MREHNIGHRLSAKQGERPEVFVVAVQRFPSQFSEESNRGLFDCGVFGIGIDVAHTACSTSSATASIGISPEISFGRRKSLVVRRFMFLLRSTESSSIIGSTLRQKSSIAERAGSSAGRLRKSSGFTRWWLVLVPRDSPVSELLNSSEERNWNRYVL